MSDEDIVKKEDYSKNIETYEAWIKRHRIIFAVIFLGLIIISIGLLVIGGTKSFETVYMYTYQVGLENITCNETYNVFGELKSNKCVPPVNPFIGKVQNYSFGITP